MKTTVFSVRGADGGCANNQPEQALTARCGENHPIDPQKEFGATPAPDRTKILLAFASEQWAHKSPEDQAIERRFIERDYRALTAASSR